MFKMPPEQVTTILTLLISCSAVTGKPTSSSAPNTVPSHNNTPTTPPPLLFSNSPSSSSVKIHGLRVESSGKPVTYDQEISVILANSETSVRLFGDGFTPNVMVRFVTEERSRGDNCDDLPSTKPFALSKDSLTPNSATVLIHLPPLDQDSLQYYICVKEVEGNTPWTHQGPEKWIVMRSYEGWLPLWAHILLLVVLLVLSGLFSGLNLGLMSMDRTELQIIENTGTEKERMYAKEVKPLRNTGNYLLCSLLLGNVMVNSTLTILLDDLTTGLIAVIGSTLGIVIFGEIIPQAVCSRHGLFVAYHTKILTRLTMLLTLPLSYPVSFILDKILGEEIGNVYNRERLRELIKVTESHNDLKKDEVNVIEGVLKLSQVTCGDAMTRIEDCFMLPLTSVLNYDTIDEIVRSGYSRIPIYEGSRRNIVSILYTKDLAFVDTDDEMPLKSFCEFYQNQCNFVEESKPLDVQLKEFKEGLLGHMAFVRRTHESESSDPYYEVIGVLTLEDVIEELIQAEISDETDIRAVLRRRRSQTRGGLLTQKGNDIHNFVGMRIDNAIVSPQLTLATFQFLTTSIPAFAKDRISGNILKRLLSKDVYFKIRKHNEEEDGEENKLFRKGEAADYFILILEGRAQCSVGRENLVFDAGPFTYFGTEALVPQVVQQVPGGTPNGIKKFPSETHFVPEYTLQAVSDLTYLKIVRAMYLAAVQTTVLERVQQQASEGAAATEADCNKVDGDVSCRKNSNSECAPNSSNAEE